MAELPSFLHLVTTNRHEGTIVWLCDMGLNLNSANRLEDTVLLFCRKQDVLILREEPNEMYLLELVRLGFELPHIIVLKEASVRTSISFEILNNKRVLKSLVDLACQRRNVYLLSYTVTESEEKLAFTCGMTLIGTPSCLANNVKSSSFIKTVSEKLGFPTDNESVEHSTERTADAYYHIFINPNGRIEVLTIKCKVINDNIYYRCMDNGQVIGAYLYNLGCRGVVGIRSMITKADVVIPIINMESNFTLYSYISFIEYILSKMKICSRLFFVLTGNVKHYSELNRRLEKNRTFFHSHSARGEFVYKVRPSHPVSKDRTGCFGEEVFVLIMISNWVEFETLKNLLILLKEELS
ncbi:hypothetical protein AV654_05815 [Paenibacillus elgii]|uniref:Pre ATP-grasp domain-containing protein n=1 Tax=Paenibacillus elgii TaxID=189691 RepID=A0A165PMF6_9BACL|nr:hypothetical protein [Paenibacillus elgii]KZE71721.1 hypothetical protein AV654_05815 [Paenibacillus elgii]